MAFCRRLTSKASLRAKCYIFEDNVVIDGLIWKKHVLEVKCVGNEKKTSKEKKRVS